MIFGGFRGLGADRSRHHAVFAVFATLSVFCLFGFLGGLPVRGRPLFLWDSAVIFYFVGVLACFAGCAWSGLRYEDTVTRCGAIAFAALPLLLALAVAARSFGYW